MESSSKRVKHIRLYVSLFMLGCILSLLWYQFGYMIIGNKAVFTNIPDGYKIVKSLETEIYNVSEKPNETVIWYSKDGLLELIKK